MCANRFLRFVCSISLNGNYDLADARQLTATFPSNSLSAHDELLACVPEKWPNKDTAGNIIRRGDRAVAQQLGTALVPPLPGCV
jgi:hypothetical protein